MSEDIIFTEEMLDKIFKEPAEEETEEYYKIVLKEMKEKLQEQK